MSIELPAIRPGDEQALEQWMAVQEKASLHTLDRELGDLLRIGLSDQQLWVVVSHALAVPVVAGTKSASTKQRLVEVQGKLATQLGGS